MAANARPRQHFSLRRIVIVLAALLFLYVLLPQLGTFRDSLKVISGARFGWLALALVLVVATSLLATQTYLLLAKRRLKYGRTLLVQLASLFTNRLLPAGIGTIGLNYEYLRHNGHQPAEAGAVVATNNLVGFGGHVLLLIVIILVSPHALQGMKWPHVNSNVYVVVPAVLLVMALAISVHTKFRSMVMQAFAHILASIGKYRAHPLRIIGALGNSMLLTACYALSLYACVHAIGLNLAFASIFIVLTFGVAGATATPTPGGLGGAEAGLLAGLVLYGVGSADALAAALLYRLFSYWFALAAGAGAFILATREGYI